MAIPERPVDVKRVIRENVDRPLNATAAATVKALSNEQFFKFRPCISTFRDSLAGGLHKPDVKVDF